MGFGLNWVTIGLDMVGWVLYGLDWMWVRYRYRLVYVICVEKTIQKFRKTIEKSEILDEVD